MDYDIPQKKEAPAILTYLIWSFLSLLLSIHTKKGQWRRRTAFLRLGITILCIVLVVIGLILAVTAAMHSEGGKYLYRIIKMDL